MNDETPEPDWRLAEPLTERVATLRSRSGIPVAGHPVESQRAKRWRAEFPFADEELFARRLSACGVSEAEFLTVVDDAGDTQPGPAVALGWAETLPKAYLHPRDPPGSTLARLSPSPADALFPFLRCAGPLIDHFAEALRENAIGLAESAPFVPYDAETVHQIFLGELLEKFKRMLAPTLVLELNLARLGGGLRPRQPG